MCRLVCLLLNFDQPKGAVEEEHSIAPLHFLDFDVNSVATRKTVVRLEEIITQKE